jgi:hypothetical protein
VTGARLDGAVVVDSAEGLLGHSLELVRFPDGREEWLPREITRDLPRKSVQPEETC